MVNMKGFAFERNKLAREELVIMTYSVSRGIPHMFADGASEVPEGYVPVGSVEFCESVLGRKVKPDYYPDFLSGHLYRKVWSERRWPLKKDIFVKPADAYKRFTGFLTRGGYVGKVAGPYMLSEKINFVKEWRYYVSRGKVLTSGGYYGAEEDSWGPELPPIEFPEGWCGAVDFGLTDGGAMALVEAQHPYAIGWYGPTEDNELYMQFLVEGWEYMKRGESK